MSLLRSELRESQAESNRLAAEKKQIENEIMALKMTLKEYESCKRLQAQPHLKPKPKPRTQVGSRFCVYLPVLVFIYIPRSHWERLIVDL